MYHSHTLDNVQITIAILIAVAAFIAIVTCFFSNRKTIGEEINPKRLITLASLFIVFTAHAQTSQYVKIETTHYKGEKTVSTLTKFDGGTVDIDSKMISIDKEAPKPQFYTIASVGTNDPQDEGYYAREYICIGLAKNGGLKAVRIVAIYTPNNKLCDLIIKTKTTHVDYITAQP